VAIDAQRQTESNETKRACGFDMGCVRTVAIELGALDVVVDEDVVLLEPRVLGDGRAARAPVGAVAVQNLLPGVGGARGGLDAEDGEVERALRERTDASTPRVTRAVCVCFVAAP
jgi:hypothetical protein